MFRKLIKHEWRATAPTQAILAAAALGVCILAGIVLRVLTSYAEELPMLVDVGMGISIGFMILAMIGCVTAMGILLLVRFYKNKFTDEGYLTFTLPVNSHQIFWSSFVNMLIWSVISILVVFLGVILLVLIGVADLPVFEMADFWEELKWALEELPPQPGYVATFIAQIILAAPYSITMTMTCITVGAVIAKKHKIIAAFGIYYGISYLTGIVNSITTVVLSLGRMDELLSSQSPDQAIYGSTMQSMIVMIVWEILLMVGGYFLTTQLMKKKLNLP